MRVMAHFVLWNLGLAQPETQTSAAERDCLARYASGRKRLVEIGVWHGVTTSRLRSVMTSDAVLFGVDPFPVGRLGFSTQWRIARKEVAKVPNGTIRWVRSTGVEASRNQRSLGIGTIDFIFIDGDHSFDGLRGDWEAWSSLVAPEGIVTLHDSCSSATRQIDDAGSVSYTKDVIGKDARFKVVEVVDTLTVLRRVGT
jgi:predicted O-methyltransferase YrrM